MNRIMATAFILALSLVTGHIRAGTGEDFNTDWKFSLEAPAHALDRNYDDSGWRTVDLPHDWVIEGVPNPELEFWEATGRLPGKGIGWYRKHFTVDELDDKTVQIIFDGVYNNADTWINGHHLGFHPYGYSPFTYDLTPWLAEGDNVITVKVDHSAYADSRWYTGAGIYRNVQLLTTSKAHIPVWGVFVTTPEINEESALINARIGLRNDFTESKNLTLENRIVGPDGTVVASSSTSLEVEADTGLSRNIQLTVDKPEPWGVESPSLYTLVSSISAAGVELDRRETPFGIRTFRFDAVKGFSLNGENLKIKGVCLHHDGGLVGAAVPKDVWRRRFETLREGGVNAIRSAHNPPSEEFLDLADEMGFLVQNEFFDEWDYPKDKRFNLVEKAAHPGTEGYVRHFQGWAEHDLKTVMLRDRNHPSIIQWSIGNEIEWTYPRNEAATGFFDLDWQGNYFFSQPPIAPEQIAQRLETLPRPQYDIGETANKLATWTRELDTTRPVTANLILPSVSHLSGYTDALDVIGYSYRRVMYDYGHEHYPDKPIMGTENLPQYHEWKAVAERDHIAGLFLWTGIRHMGELRGEWPVNTSGAGLLDLAGFKDWSWHMYRSLWRDEPHLVLATNRPEDILVNGDPFYRVTAEGDVAETTPGSWETRVWSWHPMNGHWNYSKGETIVVEAYSNADEIELFLNDESLGSRKLADQQDHIFKWAVPFAAGELKAKGRKSGETFEYVIQTHGKPVSIHAEIDRPLLIADGYSAAHVEVHLRDPNGNPVEVHDRKVTFDVPEGLKRLGVDNGALTNVQKFQSDTLETYRGRALLIVQAGLRPGMYEIGVNSDGLQGATVQVHVAEKLETEAR